MEKQRSREKNKEDLAVLMLGRLVAQDATVTVEAIYRVEERINLNGVEERLRISNTTGSISRELLNGGKSVFDAQAEPKN